jgi:hypothetical protein
MIKAGILFTLLLFTFCTGMSQVNVGAAFSTLNLPAGPLKAYGPLITVELQRDEKSLFALSAGYFTKKMGNDSVNTSTSSSANPNYLHYYNKYRFLMGSIDYILYVVGDTRQRHRVSAYLGFGGGWVYRVQEAAYYDAGINETYKESTSTFAFEFLLGIDVKLKFAKLFARGKANILLKHLVPGTDNTALPLLTNSQIGILIPLKK